MLGYDSAALIPIQPARAKGALVICGYISRGYITKAYIDAVFASGAVFLPILETDGTPGDQDGIPEQSDFDDGARQGQSAINDLRRLGYPDLGCVFTDDVSRAPYDEVKIWAKGIRSTFPNHIVFYGPGDKGDRLVDEAIVNSVWLEGALSFTPRGYQGRHYCGVQLDTQGKFAQEPVGGVTCDINTFYSTPWTSRPAVPNQPAPEPEDDFMPYSQWPQEEKDAFLKDIRKELSGVNDVNRGKKFPSGKMHGDDEGDTIGDVMQQLNPVPGGTATEGSLRRAVDDIHDHTPGL